jgi:hypothetical protein
LATLACPPKLDLARLANLTERQQEFVDAIANHDFVLYGGEAGGGKSYVLRWWLVLYLIWCFKHLGLRNVVVGLFCEDYPNLQDRQVSKIEHEFPDWLGRLTYRHSVWNFQLNSEFGGGVIALRNLDKLEKYKSAEFAAIAVDELTLNRLTVFNWLRFRLRWPGIERPKFAGATNPGGPGHDWVKNYWHLKKFPPELEPLRDQFVMVRAKASDNPHLVAGYHKQLLTLPPDMARMVAKGDWNVYTGQYFPHFNNWPDDDPQGRKGARHVIPAADAMRQLRPWHTYWISGDWGYEHPACFHWHRKDEHNRIITYRELWDRRVGESEWGQRITAASKGERLKSFPFSWDAGRLSNRSQPKYPKSIVQLLTESLGSEMPKPHPADSSPGSRMSGFRLMSQLLEADLWLISDACPKLIECLPALIRDPDDPENVLKVDYAEGDTIGDDPADSARMGLQHEFGTSIVPAAIIADRRVAEYAQSRGVEVDEMDPTARAMMHKRAEGIERRKRRNRRGGLGRPWRPRN